MLLRLTTILVVFVVWVPVAQAWSWPVQGSVLQAFSYDEAHAYDAGQHRGVDIGATAPGDPVVAPAGGTVSFAGFVPTSGEILTIETADGYSVTLTHLGSIAVPEGAMVAEGDVVATVGPSGTPEQSGPYVHLGVRITADSLGYVDPLGMLPVVETPPPTSTPAPQPVPQVVPTPSRGGGLVIEAPAAAPPAVVVPAATRHSRRSKARPKPTAAPVPAAVPSRTRTPQIRRPVVEAVARRVRVDGRQFAHANGGEPLVLAIAPGAIVALLALLTALTRGARSVPAQARVIPLRKELPVRHAA